MRLRVSLVLIAMVFAAVTAGQASAAKPGGGSNGGSCSSPTLTGPFEAHVGDSYTLDGCGFSPGSIVPLEIAEAGGCCIALNQVADQYGNFSYTGSVWATGTYRVRASVARNGSGRWRVAASWSFEAYP